ncbi:MAG TPA: iron-sulfur cluster repair di-iron protein [Cyclobacteriaceae bacterium]|nr:iron-sulfur cluster repair di-iron protein [Cyclobacteriaceae bacterium]MCB9238566.1 iron-sulfur cluster repair di-iron protein [Flammeovirgaceae bacterium]MCB0499758.1 iron-sulfur cluster repair di-iron protein [Cyclobacteriaceae bacterium]MCO5271738.1 iron-sulfur cluster repair di-iron protein [Cyclobacteriaceae bacterium]MCW5902385.1 iron-sulfur cluster repair di-iron protein [Cyclobacteriaceae bacterium]
MQSLDVTQIDTQRKHLAIFDRFDALPHGEGFIIDNDHDPKPLYNQLLAERGQTFDWEYVQKGPERWKVRLSKSKTRAIPTIGELVSGDFRKAEVFEKFGIDFCCGGKKTVAEACAKMGLDANVVSRELRKVENRPNRSVHDFSTWNAGLLMEYIINNHHQYVARSLPFLSVISAKVAHVHGGLHPEAVDIANHFEALEFELETHLQKEEKVLFPYIREMLEAKQNGSTLTPPPFGTLAHLIAMVGKEHETLMGIMAAIARQSNGYKPPSDGCTSYRILFAKLQEFQLDLHQHLHLENNILFPKALKLEKELRKRRKP